MRTLVVTAEEIRQLEACIINGNTLSFQEQLDRQLYLNLKKIVNALGGKWDKKRKTHVFPFDVFTAIEAVINTGEVYRERDVFQFFPTPPDTVQYVIEYSGITPDETCVEPEAGDGAFAAPLRELIGNDRLLCVELHEQRARALLEQGYHVQQGDFLTMSPPKVPYQTDVLTGGMLLFPSGGVVYDHVIMNPPFTGQQDIKHVLHALRWVRIGGRVTAIMSASPLFRTDTRTKDFWAYLDQHTSYVKQRLPDDAFKVSGTMVKTFVISICKERGELL